VKKRVWIPALAVVLFGAGILTWTLFRPSPEASFDLGGLDVYEAVALLESRIDEPDTLRATIDSSHLKVVSEGITTLYSLPEHQFYLSVAPYLEETHPCGIHNLISCRGELVGQTFTVRTFDAEGTLILSQEVTTGANGFFGLWLPAGLEGTLQIESDGLSGTSSISTVSGSDTCLTTVRLG